MAFTYPYLKSAFTSLGGADVDVGVLRATVAADPGIAAVLVAAPNGIRWIDEVADPTLQFSFTTALAVPLGTDSLDTIVANHTGPDTSVTVSSRTYSRTVNPAPTDNEDSPEAFAAGDQWINTADDTMWTCANAVDPAVWKRTDVLGDADDAVQVQVGRPSGQILITTGTGDGTDVVDLEDAEFVPVPAPTNYTETASTLGGQLEGIDAALAHTIASHSDTTATGAELETLTDGSNADALHAHAHSAITGVGANDHHSESHTIASHSDTTATGAELETLTDGSNADALHVHTVAAHTIASHSDTTATGAELETLTDGSNADALHGHAHSALSGIGTDDHHAESHTIASHSDTTATGAELETLTDGSNADALHTHATGVFGTELNLAESPAVSISTSETMAEKVRLPSAGDIALPAGTYLLGISYGWNHDSTNNDFEAEVRQNDVVIGQIHQQEPQDVAGTFASTGTDQKHYVTREFHLVLGAGNFHFDLRYRTSNAGDESAIWDAYMRIWRLS